MEQLKRGSMIPRATGYSHIEFGQLGLGCYAYGDIHKIRGDIGGLVTVFFTLCVVFCDEVECRATVGHVTQSILNYFSSEAG